MAAIGAAITDKHDVPGGITALAGDHFVLKRVILVLRTPSSNSRELLTECFGTKEQRSDMDELQRMESGSKIDWTSTGASGKHPYESPALTHWGTIADLTHSDVSAEDNDGTDNTADEASGA